VQSHSPPTSRYGSGYGCWLEYKTTSQDW
jgi:hypothetical protein